MSRSPHDWVRFFKFISSGWMDFEPTALLMHFLTRCPNFVCCSSNNSAYLNIFWYTFAMIFRCAVKKHGFVAKGRNLSVLITIPKALWIGGSLEFNKSTILWLFRFGARFFVHRSSQITYVAPGRSVSGSPPWTFITCSHHAGIQFLSRLSIP